MHTVEFVTCKCPMSAVTRTKEGLALLSGPGESLESLDGF